MTRSSTAATRCARSPDQMGNATSGFITHACRCLRRERLEHSLFQHLYLLLSFLERRLTVLHQLGSTLVSRQRIRQRQLTTFHGRDDGLELGQGRLEGLGCRSRLFGHGRGLELRRTCRPCKLPGKQLKLPQYLDGGQTRPPTELRRGRIVYRL